MNKVKDTADAIIREAGKIIIGKSNEIKILVMAILSNGHVLIEDVPGTGKTTLVKVIAKTMGCQFNRVQFVSDSTPGDIIGINIYNQKTSDFELRKGAVFTNFLLADEVNRAMPRTQSALLEAMEERQVTIDGHSYSLPSPFLVMATENPVEYESTFNLPLAELDRFFAKLTLGYPKKSEEKQMLLSSGHNISFEKIKQIITLEELKEMQTSIESVYLSEAVLDYILDIVAATRRDESILIGASPRAAKHLFQAAKTWAAIDGRDFATPDDVQAVAIPVLSHRLIVNTIAKASREKEAGLIKHILETTEIQKG